MVNTLFCFWIYGIKMIRDFYTKNYDIEQISLVKTLYSNDHFESDISS
jgi:hypothetical protein